MWRGAQIRRWKHRRKKKKTKLQLLSCVGPTKSNRIIRPSKPSWLCWFPCEPTGLSWPPFPFQRSPAVAFNPGSHIKITCGTSKKKNKNKNWCLAPAQGAEKENQSRWATSTTRPVPHTTMSRGQAGENCKNHLVDPTLLPHLQEQACEPAIHPRSQLSWAQLCQHWGLSTRDTVMNGPGRPAKELPF